jgi:hypothetical protein
MKRPIVTEHTVRCPLEDCTASVTVRTDPDSAPSRRHRDVIGCSLRPPTPYVPLPPIGHLPELPPPLSYFREGWPGPCHSTEPACSKACLAILNAAEPGAGGPAATASGDAMELARQIESLAMMRILWTSGI